MTYIRLEEDKMFRAMSIVHQESKDDEPSNNKWNKSKTTTIDPTLMVNQLGPK